MVGCCSLILTIFQGWRIGVIKGLAVIKLSYSVENIEKAKQVIIERKHGFFTVDACLLNTYASDILVIIT